MNTNPPSSFYVDQRVICIDDRFPPAIIEWCDSLPIAGFVYTIRAMQTGRDPVTGLSNLDFFSKKSSTRRPVGVARVAFVIADLFRGSKYVRKLRVRMQLNQFDFKVRNNLCCSGPMNDELHQPRL